MSSNKFLPGVLAIPAFKTIFFKDPRSGMLTLNPNRGQMCMIIGTFQRAGLDHVVVLFVPEYVDAITKFRYTFGFVPESELKCIDE